MAFRAFGSVQFSQDGDTFLVHAAPHTDFIVHPLDGAVTGNAAFLYQEMEGDFVIRAQVTQSFLSTYDAPALMAWESETRWAKACFEATDFSTHAIVSVMTNGRSDDCNGVNIEGNTAWLQMCRRDDVFAVHYSLDGETFRMHRILHLPLAHRLRVGLVAQSPLGEGAEFRFEHVYLASETKEDIRGGN